MKNNVPKTDDNILPSKTCPAEFTWHDAEYEMEDLPPKVICDGFSTWSYFRYKLQKFLSWTHHVFMSRHLESCFTTKRCLLDCRACKLAIGGHYYGHCRKMSHEKVGLLNHRSHLGHQSLHLKDQYLDYLNIFAFISLTRG